MKFICIEPKPANEAWAQEALEVYLDKLKPLIPIEHKSLTTKTSSRENALVKKEAESKVILATIQPQDFVVLFDESGQSLTSEKFAKQLQFILNSGKQRALFILGGAYGVSEDLKTRANLKISLAPFVMNHLVARTVALEQIYRGLCILKNLPYHNA